MDSNTAYKPPQSELESDQLPPTKKFGVWKRFYIAFLWSVPIYLFFVLAGTPKEVWITGILGALIFSVFSGVIGILIPVQRKIVFVPPGIVIGIVVAYIIGSYTAG